MLKQVTNTRMLQVQQEPKEGILLWTQSVTLRKLTSSQNPKSKMKKLQEI